MPFLSGQRRDEPHEILFWRFWRVAAVRQGPWKLLRVAQDPLQEKRDLILPLVLMNLDDDPGETRNVAQKHPKKTKELLAKLQQWEQSLAQPRWYDGRDWKHWQEMQVKNHRMTP